MLCKSVSFLMFYVQDLYLTSAADVKLSGLMIKPVSFTSIIQQVCYRTINYLFESCYSGRLNTKSSFMASTKLMGGRTIGLSEVFSVLVCIIHKTVPVAIVEKKKKKSTSMRPCSISCLLPSSLISKKQITSVVRRSFSSWL